MTTLPDDFSMLYAYAKKVIPFSTIDAMWSERYDSDENIIKLRDSFCKMMGFETVMDELRQRGTDVSQSYKTYYRLMQ